jgi:secreted trypsin-like serine protease
MESRRGPVSATLIASRRALALLIALSSLWTRVADGEVRPQVLGGEELHEATSTVAIRTPDGRLQCSAVIIGPKVALTAAHCAYGEAARAAMYALCAGDDVRSCRHLAKVTRVAIHPAYDPTNFDHDVAVVSVEQPLDVPIAALASSAPKPGDWVTMQGFGRSEADSRESAGALRQVTVPLLEVTPEKIHYGTAACKGDSGGGAFSSTAGGLELVAITSSGPGGCVGYGKSIRVDAEREFIDDALRSQSRAGCALGGAPGSAPSNRLVPIFLLVLFAVRSRGRYSRPRR